MAQKKACRLGVRQAFYPEHTEPDFGHQMEDLSRPTAPPVTPIPPHSEEPEFKLLGQDEVQVFGGVELTPGGRQPGCVVRCGSQSCRAVSLSVLGWKGFER
jgi:hypothetical protein